MRAKKLLLHFFRNSIWGHIFSKKNWKKNREKKIAKKKITKNRRFSLSIYFAFWPLWYVYLWSRHGYMHSGFRHPLPPPLPTPKIPKMIWQRVRNGRGTPKNPTSRTSSFFENHFSSFYSFGIILNVWKTRDGGECRRSRRVCIMRSLRYLFFVGVICFSSRHPVETPNSRYWKAE